MMETVVFAAALSTGVLLTDPNEEGKQAVSNISIATYRYTGLDKQIEPMLKRLEKRYIPKVLSDAGVGGYFIYRLVHDHKIGYTWSF